MNEVVFYQKKKKKRTKKKREIESDFGLRFGWEKAPRKILFPGIYMGSNPKNSTIAKCWNESHFDWDHSFKEG